MKKKEKHLITVIIPLRNTKEYHRETKRLKDCLYSLQNQTVPYEQIDVIISDTDSDIYYRGKHKEICDKFKAHYIYTKTDEIWNISRARNIGIKNAKAKLIMTTDVDCIFVPDFIEVILKHVAEDKIIHCRVSDLPRDYKDSLDNFLWLNKISTTRPTHGYGGCQVFSKKWAFKVHGFDEEYKGWGADDTDFYHRAIQDGLKSIWIEKETSFFHRWHPMDNRMKDVKRLNENRLICKLTEMGKLPIVRNDLGWGGKKIISHYTKNNIQTFSSLLSKEIKTETKNVAILVTTFMRDTALFQCIKSIRKYYPDIAIYVGDNGRLNKRKKEFCDRHKSIYIKAPFDCGVGATRNAVFKAIPKRYKYVVICEDDILFTDETRLENWVAVLDAKDDVGIVGGKLKKPDAKFLTDLNYEAWLYAKASMLYVERIEKLNWEIDAGVKYMYCDIVLNVFMMRREVWDSQKWDLDIKTWPEHEDFFFSLKKKTDWKVVYADTVSLIHKPMPYSGKFAKHRMRIEGLEVFSRKWEIEYIWNSWHKSWGKPNPMRIGILTAKKKALKDKSQREDKREIAIGIKTFLREESLFKTLDAIKKHFPFSYRLYIADDGNISDEKEYKYQKLEDNGHVIIKLPFNCGISVGRNEIIKKATEGYVLIMDDDIMFQDSKSIINMKNVLDSDRDIGLCSGMLFSKNGDYIANENYQKGLRFEIDRGLLFRYPSTKKMYKANGSLFVYADQVVNFFLAKRAIFNDVKWDNRIKVEWEHIDFFLRLKETKWKVVACINTKAIHMNPLNDSTYNYYRRSSSNNYFNQKHGIHNVINRFQ